MQIKFYFRCCVFRHGLFYKLANESQMRPLLAPKGYLNLLVQTFVDALLSFGTFWATEKALDRITGESWMFV